MYRKNFPGRQQKRKEKALTVWDAAVERIQTEIRRIETKKPKKETDGVHAAYLLEKLARVKVCIENTQKRLSDFT